ncbi:hypothetical protein Gotur_001499 [Gossypium turneri]
MGVRISRSIWNILFLSRRAVFKLSTKKISLSHSVSFVRVTSLFVQNIPIHRSEIQIYELKDSNDQLCNQLLESIGL